MRGAARFGPDGDSAKAGYSVKLLLSPHNDDEALFCAFTIMRERPTVVVAFDSYVQPFRGVPGCNNVIRRQETVRALRELTGDPRDSDIGDIEVPLHFLGFSDAEVWTPEVLAGGLVNALPDIGKYEQIWAPAWVVNGHDQHNALGEAADLLFPGKVTHYATYTRTYGKSRNGTEVQPRSGEDISRKLRALACYRSQLEMDPRLGCWPHFMNDLREYVLP